MIRPSGLVLLVLVSLSLLATRARADFLVQPNDIVGVGGDSITEQKIYSAFIEDYLLMCQPTQGQQVAAFGWSGEQAPGLLARLDTDIFPFKPTVMTLCYGMNDAGYHPLDKATVEAYRKNMTDVVDVLKKGGVRAIVVGTPGCVDSTNFKRPGVTPAQYNEALGALGDAAKDVAQKEGVAFADVHDAMMDAMEKSKAAYGEAYTFAGPDGVHPGPNGHILMAYAFLKGLGCDGAIGTITVDLAANQATGTPGQEIVSCADGTVTVNSTRYPFCFDGDPTKPDITPAAIVKFTSFNDDLNRYLLVVKNLKTAKAKVMWGKQTHEFSADELAKGVNLAAEFVGDNPFQEQFDKVDTAVKAQQLMETLLMKQFMHNQKMLESWAPDGSADRLITGGLGKDKENFTASAALVIPVQHSIKIEPQP